MLKIWERQLPDCPVNGKKYPFSCEHSSGPSKWQQRDKSAINAAVATDQRLKGAAARAGCGPICLNRNFQRKRSKIKQIGRLNRDLTGPTLCTGANLMKTLHNSAARAHDWPVQSPYRKLAFLPRLSIAGVTAPRTSF